MDVYTEIFKFVQQGGGIVAVLLMGALYFINDLRKTAIEERDKATSQKDDLHERSIKALNDAAGSIKDFRSFVEMLIHISEKQK